MPPLSSENKWERQTEEIAQEVGRKKAQKEGNEGH